MRIWQEVIASTCDYDRELTIESVKLVPADPGECDYSPVDEDFESFSPGDPIPPELSSDNGVRFVESNGGTALGFVNRDANNACVMRPGVTLPGRVPVPQAGNGVALMFDYTFSQPQDSEFLFFRPEGRLEELTPTAGAGTHQVCVGPEAYGLHYSTQVLFETSCDQTSSATLDNVRFVETADCDGNLADGTFDDPLGRHWLLENVEEGHAEIIQDGRDRYLQLSVDEACQTPRVYQSFSRMLDPTANAIRFRHTFESGALTEAGSYVKEGFYNRQNLPNSRGTDEVLCLDFSRTPSVIEFGLETISTSFCGLALNDEDRLKIEDVELVFDASCP